MIVRTYGFPGGLTRPTGDLDSQLSPRYVHVEACRPREVLPLPLKSSRATASVGLPSRRAARRPSPSSAPGRPPHLDVRSRRVLRLSTRAAPRGRAGPYDSFSWIRVRFGGL